MDACEDLARVIAADDLDPRTKDRSLVRDPIGRYLDSGRLALWPVSGPQGSGNESNRSPAARVAYTPG